MNKKFLISVILAGILSIIPASAAIDQVGIMANGPVFVVTEANGYIYAGQGGEIQVYDGTTEEKLSNLTWEKRITKFHEPTSLSSRITSLYVIENRLYGSDSTSFFIYDITNPALPVLLSNTVASNTYMVVDEAGQYVYLGGSNLTTYDLSNIAAPVKTSSISAGGSGIWRMKKEGNKIFAALGSGQGGANSSRTMSIFDVTIPANPVRLSTFVMKGQTAGASGVDVYNTSSKQYAYLVYYYQKIAVVDTTDPLNPFIVNNISVGSGSIGVNDIQIQGDMLYVSVRYEGLRAYNLTDPTTPMLVGIGRSEVGGYTEGIFIDGNHAYLAMESMGTEIYDISNPARIQRISHIFTIGGSDSIAINRNIVYLGGHNDGIWSVDVSDKANPKEMDFIYNAGRNSDIVVIGNHLYYSGVWAGLGMIDVSDPSNMRMIWERFGWYDGPIVVSPDEKHLFSAKRIADITNLSKPTNINLSPGWGNPRQLYEEHFILSQNGNNGWQFWDISNITMPMLVSSFGQNLVGAGTTYNGIAIRGNFAYCGAGNYLMVFDLSNMLNPVLIQKNNYAGSFVPSVFVIVDNTLYVSGSQTPPLKIFNINDNGTVTQVGTGAMSITRFDGTYLYSIGKYGFAMYLPNGAIPPSVTPTPITPVPTTQVPPTSPTTIPTTIPTTEIPTLTTLPTTIPTTEPIPDPTECECICPTPTPAQCEKICIEIGSSGFRLVPCQG